MLDRLKRWAGELKAQLLTLWFCKSHPDTPSLAKIFAALVVAYAFSPIDLIPDFIPIIGFLDDLVLVPLGIYVALRMIPDHVAAASREEAIQCMARSEARPRNYAAATLIVLTWIALAYWAWTAFSS